MFVCTVLVNREVLNSYPFKLVHLDFQFFEAGLGRPARCRLPAQPEQGPRWPHDCNVLVPPRMPQCSCRHRGEWAVPRGASCARWVVSMQLLFNGKVCAATYRIVLCSCAWLWLWWAVAGLDVMPAGSVLSLWLLCSSSKQ